MSYYVARNLAVLVRHLLFRPAKSRGAPSFLVCAPLALQMLSGSALAQEVLRTPAENDPALAQSYLLQAFDHRQKPNEVRITPSLKNEYFYSNCADTSDCDPAIPKGATMFKTPSGFGSTAHSEFPRVELRAAQDFFSGNDFTIEQSGSVYIVKNPSTRSTIFAQIHGDRPGGSELFKLRWNNGTVVAGIKEHFGDPEKRVTLLSNVGLKEKMDYKLIAKGNQQGIEVTVEMSANGQRASQSFSYPRQSWDGIALYFKAGNYNQDKNADGSEAVVAYTHLNLQYKQ